MTNEEKLLDLAKRIKALDFYGIEDEPEEIALDIEINPLATIEWLLEQLEA